MNHHSSILATGEKLMQHHTKIHIFKFSKMMTKIYMFPKIQHLWLKCLSAVWFHPKCPLRKPMRWYIVYSQHERQRPMNPHTDSHRAGPNE